MKNINLSGASEIDLLMTTFQPSLLVCILNGKFNELTIILPLFADVSYERITDN